MQLLNKESTIKYFEGTLGFDSKKAQISQYKVNQALVTCIYMIPAIVIAIVTNTFLQWLVALFACKLMRTSVGGIHIKSSMLCFILSLVIIEVSIWIPHLCALNEVVVRCLLMLDVVIWSLYAPAGTSQVPIRSEKQKTKMKFRGAILFTIYLILVFICADSVYLHTAVIGTSLVMLTVLPITYKIFRVSRDRETLDINKL